MKKIKTCELHTCIHVRKELGKTHKYATEVSCSIHDTQWIGLADTWDAAKAIADNFPLVAGGIPFPMGEHPECILFSYSHSAKADNAIRLLKRIKSQKW